MTLIIKFIFLQRNKLVHHKPCAYQTYKYTAYEDDTHHHKKKIHPENPEKLLKLISHDKENDHQDDIGYHSRKDTLEGRLNKERSTYKRLGSSHQLHGVNSEPSRKHIESHRIVDQHEGDEKKEGDENPEDHRYFAEVGPWGGVGHSAHPRRAGGRGDRVRRK